MPAHIRSALALVALALMAIAACTPSPPLEVDRGPSSATPVLTPPSNTPAATPAATTSPTALPTALATPHTAAPSIRPTRLTIPSLRLDSPVQLSRVVRASSEATPGCPPPEPGGTTLTVPDRGIATPEDALEGLEGKAWIYGHSRWQNQPGLFFALQDLNPGDVVLVDGVDRATGAAVTAQRFLVNGIYLADIESGTQLVEDTATDQAGRPVVILQTSAREDGANKQWLLDQQRVTAKARTVIEGSVNDPCKYLLLFVLATGA